MCIVCFFTLFKTERWVIKIGLKFPGWKQYIGRDLFISSNCYPHWSIVENIFQYPLYFTFSVANTIQYPYLFPPVFGSRSFSIRYRVQGCTWTECILYMRAVRIYLFKVLFRNITRTLSSRTANPFCCTNKPKRIL